MLKLRPVTTARDYEVIVALSDRRFPDYHKSVRELSRFDQSVRSGGRRMERYLGEVDGRIVAHGMWSESVNYFVPGRFMLSIVVDPDWVRRGIGTAFYDELVAATEKVGLTELAAFVGDADPSGAAFAVRQGFIEASREHEMRVDPSTIRSASYADLMARLGREGLSFLSLPELKARDPEWQQKIYDLYTKLDGSTPSPVPYVAPSMELLLRTEIEPEDSVPEAFFVALQGNDWIGLSEVRRSEEGTHPLRQGLTGVLPEHRGRGIATGLKVRVIEWAQGKGFHSLKTWNDATNEPMLHVNRKMGFKRHASWILFRKIIAAAGRGPAA